MKSTKSKKKPLIFLTAGGTGGHVYPAESLAEELEKRGYRLALITDKRGKDNYKGHLGKITNHAVLSGALVGKSKLFKIKSLFKTGLGVLQAGWIMLKEKPVCVVGFGGYASFPACMAAILFGVDLVIHEQNSVMSRTNRFLSKYAELIAQSFKKVKYTPSNAKTTITGMPVRANIVELAQNKFKSPQNNDTIQIMVLGGSQGAKIFGETVPQAICGLDKKTQKRIKIFQQCRKGDEDEVKQAYKESKCDVVIQSFFENMSELYSQTHLIISRAGASSISEISVAGIPSVLVPLPTAADDHQTSNAQELADANAGILIKQKDFTAETLQKCIENLLSHPEQLQQMSDNAKKTSIKDAAKRLADSIEKEVIRH